jgi:hypothetical protein
MLNREWVMEVIGSAWLYSRSSGENPVYYTIGGIPPNTNVFATISVSSFSQGFTSSGGGSVATVIRRWEVFNADGSVTPVDPGPQLSNNAVFINDCASVTFELDVNDAEGWALANVFQC